MQSDIDAKSNSNGLEGGGFDQLIKILAEIQKLDARMTELETELEEHHDLKIPNGIERFSGDAWRPLTEYRPNWATLAGNKKAEKAYKQKFHRQQKKHKRVTIGLECDKAFVDYLKCELKDTRVIRFMKLCGELNLLLVF